MALEIPHPIYKDRNFEKGGRSFYFFDFDDNVAYLTTPIVLFHKELKHELSLTSGMYAQHHHRIGKEGDYQDYHLIFDDEIGSFKYFRDRDHNLLDRLMRKKQIFVKDLAEALGRPEFEWKGPAWDTFFHAVQNQRPLSLITARGHHPETIKEGLRLFVDKGFLGKEPNYHTIYPVSFPVIRRELGDEKLELSVADLKKRAIRRSVEQALDKYGCEVPHRFGMSDDDPKNIQLIVEEMALLKRDYPHLSFFVIETRHGVMIKGEIFEDHVRTLDNERVDMDQLSLFSES